MHAGKKIIVLLLGFIMMLGLVNVPAHAAEDTFGQNLVKSYGIPDEVIQVIIDNSRLATGETLAEKQITPDTLTLNDIENLQIFRLADENPVTKGVYQSKPNAVVANWVAESLQNSLLIWEEKANGGQITETVIHDSVSDFTYSEWNLTQLGGENKSWIDPEVLLTDGYEGKKLPVLNALTAIISLTGKNLMGAGIATTIDLNGMLSQLTIDTNKVPQLRMMILLTLSIQQLSNLTSLILDHNQIGLEISLPSPDDSAYNLGKGPLNVKSLRNLSLKNNQIRVINDNLLTYAANYVKNLDLADNDINTISWNNSEYFNLILEEVKGASNIDITGNPNINFSDKAVLQVVMNALNSKGQNITMDDGTANELIQNGLSKYNNPITSAGLLNILEQMNLESFKKIIHSDTDDLYNKTTIISKEVLDELLNLPADENNVILQLRDEKSEESEKLKKRLIALAGDETEQQKKLKELLNKVITPPETAENKLELIGSALDFGQLNIAALQSDDFSVATTSPTTLKGTLLAGVTLSVSATVWQDDTDPAKVKTLKPTITFTLDGGAAALPIILDTTGQATQTILKNDTTTAQDFSYSVSDNGKFSLSKMGKDVQAGTYQGKITWEITNGVSDTAD